MIDFKTCSWNEIGLFLTKNLRICGCQRKLKSIVLILKSIKDKCEIKRYDALTPEELFITALLEETIECAIYHGTNAEYPCLNTCNPIWEAIEDLLINPNLEDN
jgi:hypothetical protein